MNKAYFIQLYDYTFWADYKLLECVMALTEEQYRQPIDFSIGPVFAHTVHIMAVEHWWLHFLKTGEIHFYDDDVFMLPREAVREKWQQEVEPEVFAYLDSLTPAELRRTVKPPFWSEDEPPVTVWQALIQVANHSTDHRAQAMAMMHTRYGAPTFGQDFLTYLEENKGKLRRKKPRSKRTAATS